MPLAIKTQPASEPLSLEEAKEHLVVDWVDDNDLIADTIKTARSAVEAHLQGPLLPTVFVLTLDGFPSEITLPVGPVLKASDVRVDYVDTAGVSTQLGSGAFDVSVGDVVRLRPSHGATWPVAQNAMDAVTVTFTAGFATASDIPPAIIGALKMTVAHFYEHREAGDLTVGARNLLTPFVRWH